MSVQRPHILLRSLGERYDFSPRVGGGRQTAFPPVGDRRAVSGRILREVEDLVDFVRGQDDRVFDETRIPMTVRATTVHGVNASIPGSRRNEMMSAVGFQKNARLNFAFDPTTMENFEAAASNYVGWTVDKARRPNHFNFFEAQPRIGLTRVEDLWASSRPLPEDEDDELALEVWLQEAAEPRFFEVLELLGLKARRSIAFEDVRVLLVRATLEDFQTLARSAAIAQLRPASSLAGDIFQVPAGVQVAAVQAAASRVAPASDEAPAVCVLDTGIREDHPLIAPSLSFSGTVVGGSGADWDGHGTKMAGLALYRDLAGLVGARGSASLSVRLESVKIQGPPGAGGASANRLPAERLRQAVDAVEEESDRSRTFCLSMNAPEEVDDGGPSSLSCEIDVLASEAAQPRLFCVAGGNLVDPLALTDYQSMNDVTGMMSPAQSWNALTVAACTDLANVPGTHLPVAPAGDLSPWSMTAVNWEREHRPPSKPDVVFEGGNQMYDRVSSAVGPHADLSLLTTSMDLAAPLTLTGQTSAATAAIAGLCASIQAEYPALWPETVRGLVVHSAEHTDAMNARARRYAAARGSLQQALLERFGHGRPDRTTAMENAADALTLINQAHLRPFRLNDAGDAAVLGQMRFHQLPWPIETLQELDGVEAELRVTLSYFVSPNPGAVIQGPGRSYASHGFNFDVKRPDETEEEAVARINKNFDKPALNTPRLSWKYGQFRGRGSVKHDRLKLSNAADLARMTGIMVFPQQGWWGRDKSRVEQQSRYALIVTIRTPEQEIYTEISTAIMV